MKKGQILILIMSAALLSSCARSSTQVWEDTKSCGRYMGKGFRSLFGKENESRHYVHRWSEEDFIPLADAENPSDMRMEDLPSRESPGDPGSAIPGIEAFSTPSGKLAQLFRSVHFETDTYSIRGDENLDTLREIGSYLAKNPKMYVFIEGHADERGAAAYNLALGSKRANSIRSILIQNGVHPDQLFTISFGKERPIVAGHDEQSWQLNRRGQFKIYER